MNPEISIIFTRNFDETSTTPKAGPGVLLVLLFQACGSTPRSTIPDLREYSPRVLPVYDFKGSGSTPRSAIPDLREYSHKSGIVPLGVLPDPLKLCTGSGHDMICRSVIILPLNTMGALPGVLPQVWYSTSGSTPAGLK